MLLLWASPCWAQADEFMRTVSFALSGNDHTELKVIADRPKCVFAINNDLFRLNNVQTDRITILERRRRGDLEQWVAVGLHGDAAVFEATIEPPKDDGSELMRQMREASPELFKAHTYTYTELDLMTSDLDRVKRAWQFIYANGCVGK